MKYIINISQFEIKWQNKINWISLIQWNNCQREITPFKWTNITSSTRCQKRYEYKYQDLIIADILLLSQLYPLFYCKAGKDIIINNVFPEMNQQFYPENTLRERKGKHPNSAHSLTHTNMYILKVHNYGFAINKPFLIIIIHHLQIIISK